MVVGGRGLADYFEVWRLFDQSQLVLVASRLMPTGFCAIVLRGIIEVATIGGRNPHCHCKAAINSAKIASTCGSKYRLTSLRIRCLFTGYWSYSVCLRITPLFVCFGCAGVALRFCPCVFRARYLYYTSYMYIPKGRSSLHVIHCPVTLFMFRSKIKRTG